MIFYPILIPTLNRAAHFKKCVESLARCTYAQETELVIGLDFPPDEKYQEGYQAIKDYLPQISGFKKITIFEHSQNLGPVGNENFLINYAFQYYDAYIFTEDDNLFSPCFLDYMNKALNQYQNDDNVAFVCGYSYPVKWESEENAILQHQYFSGWGFGEWKNKYFEMKKIFTSKYLGKYLENKENRQHFCKLSEKIYRYATLFLWLEKMPLHDATRCVYMCITGKNALMPTTSLVRNCGWDGTGVNCNNDYEYEFKIQKIDENIFFDLKENIKEIQSRALENYQQFFMGDFPHHKQRADEIYGLLEKYGYEKSKDIYFSRCEFQKIIQELKLKYNKNQVAVLNELAQKMAGLTQKQKMCLFFAKNIFLWSVFNIVGKLTDKIRNRPIS